MTPDQAELIVAAKESLRGARVLLREGLPGLAASRAYYVMFYVAQAFLLEKGLAFSKHKGTISGFGKEVCGSGKVPFEYHRFLIDAHEYRACADYGRGHTVAPEVAEEQVQNAAKFLALAERMIGTVTEGQE